jgi:hypothetical protein
MTTGGRKLTPAEALEVLRDLISGASAGLESGAELEVFDESGQSVFLAPLARHVRLDEEGIIWIRPIIGGYPPEAQGEPAYAFDLNVARRRALDTIEIRVEGSELVFDLRSKEQARVRSASPRTTPDLERWNDFYYGVLEPQHQAELDALQAEP